MTIAERIAALPKMPEAPRVGPWDSERDLDEAYEIYHADTARAIRARLELACWYIEERASNNDHSREILAACGMTP